MCGVGGIFDYIVYVSPAHRFTANNSGEAHVARFQIP